MNSAIEKLAESLHQSRNVVVLTGAGVSAESGVPTFRDTQTGLWANYRPEDLATPEAFARDPQMVWRWYQWRRELLAKVKPNAGHYALAKLQELVPEFTLITQNVDGLHQQAGSRDVIEFHGNITRTVCINKNCHGQWAGGDRREPPLCDQCGALLRPDVVWFGETIPPAAMQASMNALASCSLFISIGTSSVVQPAAELARQAIYNHATVAEINPQATPLSADADIAIEGKSGEILPMLVKLLAAQDPAT